MIRLAVYVYSALLLAACVVTAIWGEWTHWFPQRDWLGYAQDVVSGVGMGLLIVIASQWTMKRIPTARKLSREFGLLLGPLSTGEIALLALTSGIAEEAFFRGALQPLIGLVMASLIFGCLHMGPRKEYLIWTSFALLFGFAIGGVYAWRPGIVWPIATHVTVNFINMGWLVREGVLLPVERTEDQ